jgi:hypothetical protein
MLGFSITWEEVMRFNYKSCRVDVTPQTADGRFIAHADITRFPSESEPDTGYDAYACGELGTFDKREEAVKCALDWVIAWIDANWV